MENQFTKIVKWQKQIDKNLEAFFDNKNRIDRRVGLPNDSFVRDFIDLWSLTEV